MRTLPVLFNVACTTTQRGIRNTGADLRSIMLKPSAADSLPRHLQIEIITRCNLACTMCPRTVALERSGSQEERSAWPRQMPIAEFERIVAQFPALRTLSLHGIGEPLMHPHLFRMVEMAAARGIEVRFTTNATLLDRARCERLVRSGLRRIIVSLDGATPETYEAIRREARFASVVENLQTLSIVRRELKSVKPTIDLNMVVCRSNQHETAQLVELARAVGADSVILSPVQPPLPEMTGIVCDSESWQVAVTEAERRARQLGVRLYARGGARPRGERAKQTHKCLHPWLSAVVLMSGEVMPCCNIHESLFSMGNVFAESFAEVWNGARYQSFRLELKRKENVPQPCRWCPDF